MVKLSGPRVRSMRFIPEVIQIERVPNLQRAPAMGTASRGIVGGVLCLFDLSGTRPETLAAHLGGHTLCGSRNAREPHPGSGHQATTGDADSRSGRAPQARRSTNVKQTSLESM